MAVQEDLRTLYALAFAGSAGRAVLADIEARAYVAETSFSPDPHRTAFNEGRRSLALHIRRMLGPEITRRHADGAAQETQVD